MHAIAFDLIVSELKKHYKDPYHNAYAEVRKVLKQNDFYWIQGSVYVTNEENLYVVTKAMNALDAISWFRKSVRDIRAFEMKNWSNFTRQVRNE